MNYGLVGMVLGALVLSAGLCVAAHPKMVGKRLSVIGFAVGVAALPPMFLSYAQVEKEKSESLVREHRSEAALRNYFADLRVQLDQVTRTAIEKTAARASATEIRNSYADYDRAAAKLGPVSGVPGGLVALAPSIIETASIPAPARPSPPSAPVATPKQNTASIVPVVAATQTTTAQQSVPPPVIVPPIVPVVVPPVVPPPPIVITPF